MGTNKTAGLNSSPRTLQLELQGFHCPLKYLIEAEHQQSQVGAADAHILYVYLRTIFAGGQAAYLQRGTNGYETHCYTTFLTWNTCCSLCLWAILGGWQTCWCCVTRRGLASLQRIIKNVPSGEWWRLPEKSRKREGEEQRLEWEDPPYCGEKGTHILTGPRLLFCIPATCFSWVLLFCHCHHVSCGAVDTFKPDNDLSLFH